MESFEEENKPRPNKGSLARSLNEFTKIFHAFEGTFYAALNGCLFTFGPMLVKYLPFNAFELLFYIDVSRFVFNLPYMIKMKNIEVNRQAVILFTIYIVFGFVAQAFRLSALKIVPLGDASVIAFSIPLFQAISARIFLKERLTVAVILSVVISSVGLCLTMRLPELITSENFGQRFGTSSHLIGCALALTSVLMLSVVGLIPRKLKNVPNVEIILPFFGGLTRGVIAAIVLPLIGLLSPMHDCSFRAWLLVVFTLLKMPQTLFWLMAIKREEVYFVSAVTLSVDIFLSFVWQVTIFGDPVEIQSLLGAIIVFLGGMLMPFSKFFKSKPEDSTVKKWFNFLT